MKTTRIIALAVMSLALLLPADAVQAKGDDFKSVVKLIEQFYGVKQQGIPFLAKAGMKVATTAAKIKGGTAKRIAEAGSVKLAVFEDQAFNKEFTQFRTSLNAALNETWSPLIQTFPPPAQIKLTSSSAKPVKSSTYW